MPIWGILNPKIHAITAAMRKGTGTALFERTHPERFYDGGIAEQHAVTFAGGLATQGEIPVVCIYSIFLKRAFDQVIHDVCLMGLPVRFIMDRAGIVGGDGDTHQGILDMIDLRSLPNIVLGAPADEHTMHHFIHALIEYDQGPIEIRVPRLHVEHEKPLDVEQLERIPIGNGVREREGPTWP